MSEYTGSEEGRDFRVGDEAERFLASLESDMERSNEEAVYRKHARRYESIVADQFRDQGVDLDFIKGTDFDEKYRNLPKQDRMAAALLQIADLTAISIQAIYDEYQERVEGADRRDNKAIEAIALASVSEAIPNEIRQKILAAIRELLGSERYDHLMKKIRDEDILLATIDQELEQKENERVAQENRAKTEETLTKYLGKRYSNHDDWNEFVTALSIIAYARSIGMSFEYSKHFQRKIEEVDQMADRMGLDWSILATIYDEIGITETSESD